MRARTSFVAAALLIASVTAVLAGNVAGTVIAWDPANRIIQLDDLSKFAEIPKTVTVPPNLKVGDRVTVDYETSEEEGYEVINSITMARATKSAH